MSVKPGDFQGLPMPGAPMVHPAKGSLTVPLLKNPCARPTGARSIGVWVGIGCAWCVLLGAGWWHLCRYTYRPSAVATTLSEWPHETAFAPSSGFRIVMFVHPLCPCSDASIRELENSLARMPAKVSVTVIAVTAGLTAEDLESSGLIAELSAMPRIGLYVDATGAERKRFGAAVSGEVVAFDANGRRVYHGGLTPGRGHQGESVGQGQLEALARGESAAPCESPVFGCLLPGAERPSNTAARRAGTL
ncbi:MAG TPA: hypothetical protein VL475_09165 [Planctomycetaceae bacterium]|nr:hypothetical protein [Planctomycetaceae bacterium]